MIGDHQPVERAAELGRLAAGGHHLLTTRKTVSIIQPEARTKQTGVHRQTGMQMRVAPKDLVGEAAIGVGRIGLAWIEIR
jgi:hypothetical protein